MPLFTAETAATMAKRRWEAEREREAQPRILPAPTDDKGIPDEVSRVRAQIEALNEQLDSCTEPDDWDCLTRSKERLFKQWVYLAGIPGPGNLKPSQPRQNTRKELPPPTVAQAQPSAQQVSAEAGQGNPTAG